MAVYGMDHASGREPEELTKSRTSDLADSSTPFIHNAWYVIAPASEVSRTPIARTVLGTSLVLFRRQDGTAVALQNRCCHRSFPLSHGTVDGDSIVCGYHGLRYDTEGRCIEIPMQKTVPASMRVRAYTLAERGPFIWVWKGEKAPPEEPPHQSWLEDPQWSMRWGYLHVKGSYVHMHENLLDLSHLSFLHARTFGTPEYARTPVEMNCEGDDLEVWRHVKCQLPAIYAKPLGWTDARALRSSGSKYVSPGLHVNTGIFRNLDLPDEAQSPQPMVKVAQLVTPETAITTHYWTAQARNFATGDADIGEFMINAQIAAFKEDAFALERITEMQALAGGHPQEFSIPTDKAGVLMRRRLKKLADLER